MNRPLVQASEQTRAMLAYGVAVALGLTAAVLILSGTPFAHYPLGI